MSLAAGARGAQEPQHRGREILEYFGTATQIRLTATPKETKYASNIAYFGEPVFSYTLKQGICFADRLNRVRCRAAYGIEAHQFSDGKEEVGRVSSLFYPRAPALLQQCESGRRPFN